MTIDAHNIVWPSDEKTALAAYLGCLTEHLETIRIQLPDQPNPALEIAKRFLAGEITDEFRLHSGVEWWNHIEAQGGIFDFKSVDIIHSRISLCLLTGSGDDCSELSESMNWFAEFLRILGYDNKEFYNAIYKNFKLMGN